MKAGTYKHSEEMKKYLSEIRKGIVFTEEHKANIKKNHAHACLGRKHTAEELKKMSDNSKGRKLSNEHLSKIRRENHYRWNGGNTSFYLGIRGCHLYRQWRQNVFRRDGFTCVECGDSKGGNLNADHIKPFSIILEDNHITTFEQAEWCDELWDISNGRTLCEPCHIKTPTFGRKVYNYKKTLTT